MNNTSYFGISLHKITGLTIVIVFFLISFRAPGVNSTALDYSVPPVINIIQQYSLVTTLLLMLLLSLIIWGHSKHIPAKYFSKGIVSFYIFRQILALTDYFQKSTLVDLISEITFNTICLFFFGYVIKFIYYNHSNIKNLPYPIVWGVSLFVLFNAVLYFAGIGNMMWKGRFFGLTSQPNFIGICAGLAAVAITSIFQGELTLKNKLALAICLTLSVFVCFISGSRSSMIACVIGFSVINFLRIKNSIARFSFALLAGSFIAVALALFDPTQLNYTNRGNTREETWASLMEIVSGLPIIGLGTSGLATTNSYLYSIAAAGIIGAFFFFKAIFHITQRLKSMNKPFLENDKLYSFFWGSLMFVLVGAVFEGFLLDSASIAVFVFWFLASLGK